MLLLIASYLAGLLAALLVHEGGHLAAGLVLRCDPRLICIGSGPALLRHRIGTLWVVLRALPGSGHVMLPPRSEKHWLASLAITAAGPAANAAALAPLLVLRDRIPDPLWFMLTFSQALFVVGSLLPYTRRINGSPYPSDGMKLLTILANRRSHSIEAIYDDAMAQMRPGGEVPAMTSAFAEIVLAQGRLDGREAWGRRQAIEAMEAVLAGPAANAAERCLARAVLHGYVDAEQDALRRGRKAAPEGAPRGSAAPVAAMPSTDAVETADVTSWLWVGVLVVVVIGTVYDYRRQADGEAGRLDAAELHFDLDREQVNGHRVVALRGTIGGGGILELRQAIARYGLGEGDILLLDSPGGHLGNAAVMGRIIRRHGLATAVGTLRGGRIEPASCASACVALFAAGTRRILPDGSRIGIHRFTSLGTEGMTASEIAHSNAATERREVAYFGEMGIEPGLEEAAAQVDPDDIRWLTPDEALDFKLATARGDVS